VVPDVPKGCGAFIFMGLAVCEFLSVLARITLPSTYQEPLT
jgi:hypothetical protein